MQYVPLVQVLQTAHDLDCVDAHQRLIKLAEPVEDLPDRASRDHFKHEIYLVVPVLLHAVILDYVWMAQILEQVDLELNLCQFILSFDSVRFLGQLDALDSEEAPSVQVQSSVDLAKGAFSDQIVLLVLDEHFFRAGSRMIHEHIDGLWL